MNTTPSDSDLRPRLVCRIVRQWCAVFGGQNSRHVASCADCQAYFHAGAALENALRLEARELVRTTPVSDGFERRLLQAVRSSRSTQEPVRSTAWGSAWGIGAVTAAAAIAVVAVYLNRDADPFGRSDVAGTTTATDAAVMAEAVESLSNQLVESVIPSAGKLVAANPLQQELGSVYSDMRSAIDFLALNFLPSGAPAPASAPTRTI